MLLEQVDEFGFVGRMEDTDVVSSNDGLDARPGQFLIVSNDECYHIRTNYDVNKLDAKILTFRHPCNH